MAAAKLQLALFVLALAAAGAAAASSAAPSQAAAAAAAARASRRGLRGAANAEFPSTASCRKFEGYQGLRESRRPPPYVLAPGYESQGPTPCRTSCDCHDTRVCKFDGWGAPRCWPATTPDWQKGGWSWSMGGDSVFGSCLKNDAYKWEPAAGEQLPEGSGDADRRVCLNSCQCDGTDLCTEDGWCMDGPGVLGQGTPFLT
ncbi:hypothetical protein MNEG_7691 [Monoraphidium neglectum]|uniref:Uncharacterized protein n=1 Tax=Monoraphidium neglectum TaxID=145388 RepID=A0A0D2MHV6_9CHLO|nr:hypothetical protein MNEG_7691 [Monoraphidium neglectum]KIZ00272.1 hypothetical protein MNEG_7691 [Monoraphidium neglectum]|eukprot:XP_013899291.1 hypothetical protein MNEG_7691 [Monoraphidium neglectum]